MPACTSMQPLQPGFAIEHDW
jgi:hypothetical protein